jgi:hypothetical protein
MFIKKGNARAARLCNFSPYPSWHVYQVVLMRAGPIMLIDQQADDKGSIWFLL